MSGNTPNLGLATPSMTDAPSQTIPQLAQNFQTIDNQIGSLSKKVTVAITDYGTVDATGVTDCTSIVQQAINAVHNAGGGTVLFPAGTFKISAISGTVQIPAFDDGTVQSGYGTTMSPETAYSINYSIQMYTNVRLKGMGEGVTTINGGYTYGSADLNQIIMFAFLDAAGTEYYNGIQDLTIQNAFMAYAGMDQCIVLSRFERLQFNNCAFGIYAKQLERCHFEEIYGQGTGSLVIVGGQWRTRNDNYNEAGGWADKNYFNKIHYVYQRVIGTNESNIDTFFDTYFFKTANNNTRLSSPIQTSSIAKILNYRGICGTAINILPRYWRQCNSNHFGTISVAYAPRYGIYAGNLQNNTFDNLYFESCGYQDNVNHTGATGGGTYSDPYLGNGVKIPSLVVGTDNTSVIKNIQVQNSYVSQILDNNVKYLGKGVYNTTVTTTLPDSRMGSTTLTSPTLSTPSISGGTITSDITAGYHFVGDNSGFTSVPVTSNVGTRTLTFPSNGVYLVNVMASGNGGYDHVISQSFIVTFLEGGTYGALGTDGLGTAKKAAGSNAPTGISLSAPTSAGVITATATGCPTTNVFIRFDVTKLSLV